MEIPKGRQGLNSLRSKPFRGFSSRSRHFLLLGGAKIGASAKNAKRGEGRQEKETLSCKPHDFEKCPFDTFTVGYIHSMAACE